MSVIMPGTSWCSWTGGWAFSFSFCSPKRFLVILSCVSALGEKSWKPAPSFFLSMCLPRERWVSRTAKSCSICWSSLHSPLCFYLLSCVSLFPPGRSRAAARCAGKVQRADFNVSPHVPDLCFQRSQAHSAPGTSEALVFYTGDGAPEGALSLRFSPSWAAVGCW